MSQRGCFRGVAQGWTDIALLERSQGLAANFGTLPRRNLTPARAEWEF